MSIMVACDPLQSPPAYDGDGARENGGGGVPATAAAAAAARTEEAQDRKDVATAGKKIIL